MNCDDHLGLIRKFKKDPANYRPDILHQCLLMLQDSPLNQSGLLQVNLFYHYGGMVVEVEGRNRDDECSGMPVEKQRPCLLLPRLECLIVW